MASKVKVSGIAYLGRDPETRFTPSGAMNVSFSVADSQKRGDQEITTWYNVTAWGKLAESLNKLADDGALRKGSQVFVTGSLIQREYTDKSGFLRTSLDVNADDVYLTAGAKANQSGQLRRDPNYQAPDESLPDDVDDIPF